MISLLLKMQLPISLFAWRAFLFNVLLIFYVSILFGQSTGDIKRFHQGIFLQAFVTKQVYSDPNATSQLKPGFSLGGYQHVDLSPKLQLRIGAGVSWYKNEQIDYSPLFGNDLDTINFEFDIKKSYVKSSVNVIQLDVPVNFRFKVLGDANHCFVAPGIEGRIIVSDKFHDQIKESDLPLRSFDNGPFYDIRKTNVAGTLEAGYEFLLKNGQKFNAAIFCRYGILSHFTCKGSSFANINSGHNLGMGMGCGIIF